MDQTWSDQAQLFYEPLISMYLDGPGTVTRAWIWEEIQAQLSRPSCSFVLIVGEPGAGKTGLMAALARRNPDWLRYFVRLDSTAPLSSGDATSMFLRIGHQLAHRHPALFDPELLKIEVEQRVQNTAPGANVVGVKIDDLQVSPFYRTAIRVEQKVSGLAGGLRGVEISRANIEPRLLETDTLSHLALLDPAHALAHKTPDATLVVLIDALDEMIGKTSGTSVLDWLETLGDLPPNTRFVLSSRPNDRLRMLESVHGDSLQVIKIDTESPQVTADVRVFVASLFDETQILTRAPELDADRSISSLVHSAQGNFAYLTAYARALRAAIAESKEDQWRELIEFESLPSGLSDLYAAFARRMRRQIEQLGQLEIASPRGPGDELTPAWEGAGQRILCVLAVAFAPLTLKQLVALGGIRVWESAAGNVLRTLQPFLDAVDSGWQLFHPSLGEFLTSAAQDAQDIAVDAHEWHNRIIRHYRGYGEWTDVDWHRVDSYGLMHVASHLVASDPDPTAATRLVTSSLRSATSERFFSDLPFLRIVQTTRERINTAGTVADVLSEGIFLQLVVSGLCLSASKLAPAVYGLMACLGRVDEALARADVMEPGLRKFRTIEAIRESTPIELRAQLGPLDGVERLVSAAVEIPPTAGPIVGALGYDLATCLQDAAVAMVPHDFERALHLAELADKYDRVESATDTVYGAAAPSSPPEQALEMLAKIQNKPLQPTVDTIERAAPGPARDSLLAFAFAHLQEQEDSRSLVQIARLLVILAKNNTGETTPKITELRAILDQAVSATAKEETSSMDDWSIIRAAELVHEVDPDLAQRLLKSCDQEEVDSLLADTMVNAARLWVAWGNPEEARARLHQALQAYRALGWFGPARDIARASRVAANFDPAWAEELTAEAIDLVETAIAQADDEDWSRLNGTISGMVDSFRPDAPDLALKVARWARGDWIHGGPWDSTDGRGAIAIIGLDVATQDPALAQQLLAECLYVAEGEVRLGRSDPQRVSTHLFKPTAQAATSMQTQPNPMVVTYVMNFVNYWASGRDWRFFGAPAEVLRSIEAVFPDTASWARALAAGVQAVAVVDIEQALAMASWLADPCEKLVAIASALAQMDQNHPLFRATLSTLVSTLGELPNYQAQTDLSKIPQGPVLAYLDPSLRARFEAEQQLPPNHVPMQILPEQDDFTWYLHLTHDADAVFDALIDGTFRDLSIEDLQSQLDGVLESYGRADPLFRDLLGIAATYAVAERDPDLANARIEAIEHPSLKTIAKLARMQFEDGARDALSEAAMRIFGDLSDEVSALHRAHLAATAALICQFAEQSADVVVEWGLQQQASAAPLLSARGLNVLAAYVPEQRREELLTRALRTSQEIGNQYLRTDAQADMLASLIESKDTGLVAKCLEQLLNSRWSGLMDALRRAMPVIVKTCGVEMIERMDSAMRRAQEVLTTHPQETAPSHFDGVLPEAERKSAAALLLDAKALSDTYLSTFLDQEDVGPSLQWAQDSRISVPDPDDQAFARLHGSYTGLSAWQAGFEQTIWRIVDIRFLFGNQEDAANYHRERLEANSEGHPPLPNAPAVGEDCSVFGGTESLQVGDMAVTLTAFYYIFRVGRMVVKLFVAQGQEATDSLTPERVVPLAERIVYRIRTAGIAD